MNPLATLMETARPRPRFRLPVAEWIRVARERRQLAALDVEALRGMGIDPAEARREARRPFWDLPVGR